MTDIGRSNYMGKTGGLEESGDAIGRRLREDARACLDAAITAVDPARLVTDTFQQHPETIPGTDPVHVVSVGKAAEGLRRIRLVRPSPGLHA